MIYSVKERLSDEIVARVESLSTIDLVKICQRIAEEERWGKDDGENRVDTLPRKALLKNIFKTLAIYAPRSDADKWMLLEHWFYHAEVEKCGENL